MCIYLPYLRTSIPFGPKWKLFIGSLWLPWCNYICIWDPQLLLLIKCLKCPIIKSWLSLGLWTYILFYYVCFLDCWTTAISAVLVAQRTLLLTWQMKISEMPEEKGKRIMPLTNLETYNFLHLKGVFQNETFSRIKIFSRSSHIILHSDLNGLTW